MPHVPIDGARCHYTEQGSGPALLLIHGLGASQADWFCQLPALSDEFRCVMPDLVGHGQSDSTGDYAIFAQARRLLKLLDTLGIDRCAVLGHSMGGAVAQSMALLAPDRIIALVICNSSSGFRPVTGQKMVEAVARFALVGVLGVRPLAALIAFRLFPHAGQESLREIMREHFAEGSRRVYLRSLAALGRWAIWSRLPEIRARTLIVAAEHDYFPLAETERMVAGIPGARLELFAGSRHGTPMDRAEAFNTAVIGFLRADASAPVAAVT